MSLIQHLWKQLPERVKEGLKELRKKKALLGTNSSIHPTATIGHKVKIGPNVSIGRYTNINENTSIRNAEIGSFCALAPEINFISGNHVMKKPALQAQFYTDTLELPFGSRDNGGIKVGHDVWIGYGAVILPEVEIGDGAIIGARSVVTKDVEPYEVVAGNPARHIRYRFDEGTREDLLELEWWDWPIERIKKNRDFFDTKLNENTDIELIEK
jgi:acetyltransferase-like isoleucine patch superfamily enzyme